MTSRARATALAALVVFAVVAGSAALAGGAAAASGSTNATGASLTAHPNTTGAVSTHAANVTVGSDAVGSSLNGVTVDYTANTGATDASNVDQSDVYNASIIRNGSTINVSDDLSSVTQSNNGHTLTFGFGGSYDLHANDTVHLRYGNVRNPSSAGNYSVTLAVNPQSAGTRRTVNYTVASNPASLNATFAPNDDGRNATHRFVVSPNRTVTFDNVSVHADWNHTRVHGVANVSAFVDTNGNGAYDAGTDRNVTVVGERVHGHTVDVQFSANQTLTSTERLVFQYDAPNPSTTGEHTVGVRLGNGSRLTDTVSVTDGPDWGDAHISARPSASGATSTHTARLTRLDRADVGDSLNKFRVDYAVGSAPADVSNVGVSDVKRIGIERNGTFINVSDDLSSVGATNDGHTLTFGFGGSYTLHAGDRVVAEYGDVQNPNVSETTNTTVAVGVNSQSNPYNPAHTHLSVTSSSTTTNNTTTTTTNNTTTTTSSTTTTTGSANANNATTSTGSTTTNNTTTTTGSTTTNNTTTTTGSASTSTTSGSAGSGSSTGGSNAAANTASSGGSTPGFGVGVALVALAGAALLARRRD